MKGHQSSGARAPELWCPHNFFSVFFVVYPQFCWQYSDITRKCKELINTLGKKDKLIFLMPILEITIKKPVVNLKGHQRSGARAPELWCPHIFFGVFFVVYSHLCWQCSDKTRKCQEHINILGKKDKLTFLTPILEIKTKKLLLNLKGHQSSGAWAPELWCPLSS